MSKGFKAIWLGDDDPTQQVMTEGGLTFVKGEAVTVPEDLAFNGHPWAETIRGNPAFSIDDAKAEPVKSTVEEVDPEKGSEKAALKAELASLGVVPKGNPSEDTLRKQLAEASQGKA